GQISGPITFLSTVKDTEGKPLIFNEIFEDIFIKILGMKGLWMAKKIKEKGKIPIIFYDEPVMSSFGSAFFPVDKNRIINIFRDLIKFLRERNNKILIGVHCCGNTDWNIFLNLDIDILSFDSFNFSENFFAYWEDIKNFLQNGKLIAWGIVPSTDEIENVNFEQVKEKLYSIYKYFEEKGNRIEEIKEQFIFTPSCGMGYVKEKNVYKIVNYLSSIVEIYK
ncbi:MAG: hypothetical protein NC917_03905, partial [Candidatus Omnitrophica bacterium]|nr:hypothetical protein [Candidatus Omnitrophota bacterium]